MLVALCTPKGRNLLRFHCHGHDVTHTSWCASHFLVVVSSMYSIVKCHFAFEYTLPSVWDALTLPCLSDKSLLTEQYITFPGKSSLITTLHSSEIDHSVVLRPSYLPGLEYMSYCIVFIYLHVFSKEY